MIRPQTLISSMKEYIKNCDENIVQKAYIFALDKHGTQIRESGDPYFSHPLEVAKVLIDLRMDTVTVVAGILHDTVEDTNATIEEIETIFGKEVAKIVDGVTKLSKFEISTIAQKQTENFKKLLLSAASDIRVLIIKLADRLHNMRTLKYKKKKSKRLAIAMETLEIYAPLAERIGIVGVKDELQDVAFMELHPDIYLSIKSRLKNLYESSEVIINTITSKLKELSGTLEISCIISGRLKTPYSIWQKMNVRSISFEQLSDIMAFRIIVDNVQQCYQMLGGIHRSYIVVPGRFRDYISTPKNNSYQSLHTSVIGPLNKRIEVQIRTKDMHAVAEYGVAAHCDYKDGGTNSKNKLRTEHQWLKNLVQILENTSGMEEFLQSSKTEMLSDHIFCMTPAGTLISLPKGASVLDFAYAIHSEVGNHASAAKVNGQLVSLKNKIENGDQIEIITSQTIFPKPSWSSYVITMKAKSNIKKALNSFEKEKTEMIGKSNFDEFFKKRDVQLSSETKSEILKKFKLDSMASLFLAIGNGSLTIREIFVEYNLLMKSNHNFIGESLTKKNNHAMPISCLPDIPILPITCCSPVLGDKIVGVLFPEKGIEIHIEECLVLKDHSNNSDCKIIELSWDTQTYAEDTLYLAKLIILTTYESGNLSKIANIIEKHDANVVNLKIGEKFENFMQLSVEIEVTDIAHLSIIISHIKSMEFVSNIDRS